MHAKSSESLRSLFHHICHVQNVDKHWTSNVACSKNKRRLEGK